jgi:hypothetical protein
MIKRTTRSMPAREPVIASAEKQAEADDGDKAG